MRILLAADADNSNVAHTLEKALRAHGVDARAIKSVWHPFNYPEQAKLFSAEDLEFVNSADLFHVINSRPPTWLPKRDVPTIVQHGGANYRFYHSTMDGLLRPWKIVLKLIETPDLLGITEGPEEFFSPPIDVSLYEPNYAVNSPLKIGHFPTNEIAKGTDKISKTVRETLPEAIYHTRPVLPWRQHILQLTSFDIVIETMCRAYSLKGEPPQAFGESGMTAKEAAACGCVVITNCRHPEVWGKRAILYANDTTRLAELLLDLDNHEVSVLKRQARAWIEKESDLAERAKWLTSLYARYV